MNNKVAVVTGDGFGFGEGIVHTFIAKGAKVLVAHFNESAAQCVQPAGL